MNKIVNTVLALLVLVTSMFAWHWTAKLAGPESGPSFRGVEVAKCNTNTVTRATVGGSNSSTLLAANENRAWATLTLIEDASGVATSTVSVSLDEGAAATRGSGLMLSSTTPSITFGRNTELPYTGAVTGINYPTASTSVQVTECSY